MKRGAAVLSTQPAHDVPGTSPEGLLTVLTSGTYRGPSGASGDSQVTNTKIDDLMKKLCFRSSSPCIIHLSSFFARPPPPLPHLSHSPIICNNNAMGMAFLVQMRQSNKCGSVSRDEIINLHLGSGIGP